MKGKLRVGIIGLGQIAKLGHIPGYQKTGAVVTAACDANEATAKQVCENFGIPKYYLDWKEMLAAGGFDAVSICTPPTLHSAMVIECARRGLPVLVEKPMAPNLSDCDQMIKAAQDNNVLLMVSHNQRYMPAHMKAKEIIESGRLGKPYIVQTVFGHGGPEKWSPSGQWYFSPEVAKMGVMSDLGYHKIDLIQWLLDQEIIEIGASMGTFEKETTLEDSVACVLKFSKGVIGTMIASWVYKPDMENSLTIRFEKGVLTVPSDPQNSVIVRQVVDPDKTEEINYKMNSSDNSGWFGAVSAFVNAVENDKPSPVPGAVGKQVMTVLLRAYESVSSKQMASIR
jgi:UDP-N-acetylglucosamine 3-dehydrogenase